MDETWEPRAFELAERIAEAVSAGSERDRLSEKLLAFRFKPKNEDAAEMGFVVSPYELIFSAGRGTRFELDALPSSEERVVDLALAIAGGGLSEQIWPHRVKFELRFSDGTVVRGGSRHGLIPRLGRRRSVTYPPYDQPGVDDDSIRGS